MREIVLIPCDGWKLHGLVHVPLQPADRRVGVILFHENQNTKFGAHRLFQRLGDALAQAGFYALRYDDRGNCDSPGICELTIAHRLADARAAVAYFRAQYSLDVVVGWGLCLGAAVAVSCGAEPRNAQEKLDALILCNILADPARVSRPEWGYQKTNLPQVAKDVFFRGNFLRKILNAHRNLSAHRTKLRILAARYLRRQPRELVRLRKAIGRVGKFLQAYQGPSLMIFSEKDTYLTEFVERVNPGDKLGLNQKAQPPAWIYVKNADHMFASGEKTAELTQYTLEWLEAFREGRPLGGVSMMPEAPEGVSMAELV
jgi:pimeloyl-ACP methyl ester carboxylesterase